MADARRSAFIVANDEYADPRLRRLRAPAADARELAGVLQAPDVGGFDVSLSLNEPEHVVRRRLAEFFEDRGPDDLLLLHLSCHGVKDEDGRLYFAAPDTQMDHLEATALPAEFVNRQMTRSRSRRVVLLLDCCYSGAFARGWMSRAGDTVDLRDRFEGHGRIVLTASSAMEYSFEGDQLSGSGKPSVFTSALVQGLATGEADRNRDGYISVDELYDYAYDRVRADTPSQTPGKWVFDVQGDFLLARSRLEPLPPPSSGIPPELMAATLSPFAHIRLGAVAELQALLDHPDASTAAQARDRLGEMAEDDSQRVSRAAADAVAPEQTQIPMPTPTPPPPDPAPPPERPRWRAGDEPLPRRRAAWLARAGAVGLLGVVLQSRTTFADAGSTTGWNAYAALSPVEGVLAALAVWLLASGVRAGHVPTSVAAGALLVLGGSATIGGVGLTAFTADWSSPSTPYALVVVAGGLLTTAAGVDCLLTARSVTRSDTVTAGQVLTGAVGAVLALAALFLTYDGESSLVGELQEGLGEYFFVAAFDCLLAVGAVLLLRVSARLGAGALLASGGVLAAHYLGIVLASEQAIGEPGATGWAGFVGIVGGLVVASVGISVLAGLRPRPAAAPRGP